MNSLKGLTTKNIYSDDALLPFNKRHDQIQKTLYKIFGFYRSISEIYITYNLHLEKTNQIFSEKIFINGTIHTKFFTQIANSTKLIHEKIKIFSISQKTEITKLLTYCNDYFDTLRNVYLIFRDKIKVHQKKQEQVIDLVKKYSKDHKMMISMMQSYKNSFNDPKLIYNQDEKNKRYNNCSQTYELLQYEYKDLNQKIEITYQIKKSLKQSFQNMKRQFVSLNKSLAIQFIHRKQQFCINFLQLNRQIYQIVSKFTKIQKQNHINTIFQKFRLPFSNPQYFSCVIQQKKCLIYPSFLQYFQYFKPQHLKISKKLFVLYFKQVLDDIEQRTILNEFLDKEFSGTHAQIQGFFIKQLRQSMSYYQKIKKNVTCYFCQEIQQSLSHLFQFLVQLKNMSQTSLKPLNGHIKSIKQCLSEENKLLQIFQSQFKNVFYQLFGKKQLKKIISDLDQDLYQQVKFQQKQLVLLKPQLNKKVVFLRHFIEGFIPKFNQNSQKLKNSIIQVFIDLKLFLQQNTKKTNNLIENKIKQKGLLDQKENLINMQQLDKKEVQFFATTLIQQVLVKAPLQKLQFDGQFDKIQEFKRIKKPQTKKDEQLEKNKQKQQKFNQKKIKSFQPTEQNQSLKQEISVTTKKIGIKDKFFSTNYKDFIMKKTKFAQDEQFVSSFACGIADNIIVSGRLYLTNLRLLFHSNFNSKNIFFGSTFIQIPRTDIKRIQKRYNAVIFDNSLSITTINGQIFFTSFVSRNTAFDLIIKTFDINNDQNIFVSQKQIQEEQQIVEAKDFNLTIAQEDDLNELQIPKRLSEIQTLLGKYEYQSIGFCQFQFPGLTAVKYFKIFDSGQEILFNKKLYKSFNHYFQESISKHQKVQIAEWQPNIISFLNPCNLKVDSPIKCSRALHSQIPTPNSGLPFMPKFVISDQNQDLYFISKDKYIMESKVQNSKAPYTDSFYLRYKKQVQTIEEGKVRVEHFMQIIFVKKILIRSMIQTRSFEQSRQTIKKSFDHVKKQLKSYLQKPKKKQTELVDKNKEQNINSTSQQYKESNQQQQKIFQQTKQELQKIKAQLHETRQKSNKHQKLLIVSLIANMILLIIYLAS